MLCDSSVPKATTMPTAGWVLVAEDDPDMIVGGPFELPTLLAVVAEATQRLQDPAPRTLVASGPRSSAER
jgi:hypothetical protein